MTGYQLGRLVLVAVVVWCVLVWVGISVAGAAMPPSFPLTCTMPEDLK
jgi:hypothetical protein